MQERTQGTKKEPVDKKIKGSLIVKNLVKSFQSRTVVNGVSLEVHPGEVVGLLGPNGAGKTTAFYMIIGLIQPDGGEVLFGDEEITFLPMHERAAKGVGYLAQEPSIFRELSVAENILMILEMRIAEKVERLKKLEQLLAELSLSHLRNKRAETLSGGERRRLEIARALACEPKCLLLDEPFANVDPIAVADVRLLIRQLSQRGIGVLITDHNAREIFSVVDRSYLVASGKVLLSGTVEELIKSEEARKIYFGQEFCL
jgi:lipopolysaccharide export system ATP-binding protein